MWEEPPADPFSRELENQVGCDSENHYSPIALLLRETDFHAKAHRLALPIQDGMVAPRVDRQGRPFQFPTEDRHGRPVRSGPGTSSIRPRTVPLERMPEGAPGWRDEAGREVASRTVLASDFRTTRLAMDLNQGCRQGGAEDLVAADWVAALAEAEGRNVRLEWAQMLADNALPYPAEPEADSSSDESEDSTDTGGTPVGYDEERARMAANLRRHSAQSREREHRGQVARLGAWEDQGQGEEAEQQDVDRLLEFWRELEVEFASAPEVEVEFASVPPAGQGPTGLDSAEGNLPEPGTDV